MSVVTEFRPNSLNHSNALEKQEPASWNHRAITRSRPCTCAFIPPYIQQKAFEATHEQHLEHQEYLETADHKKHCSFREWRKALREWVHHHDDYNVPIESPEARAKELVSIFDCKGKEKLSKKIILENHDTDVSARARRGLEGMYLYNQTVHGRDSLDGRGMPIKGYIHYGADYSNAFWDEKEMIFGPGDNKVFTDFTIDLDVIGHELTHAVTQYTADFVYKGQSGAINEHISDVFGSMFKQWTQKESAEKASWLIGDAVLIGPGALRSMKNPGSAYKDHPILGSDSQPSSFADYVKTKDDDGGVHTNSGIPNKAFYEVSVAIGGNAWEKAGKIWYDTLTNHTLKPSAKFIDFARGTHLSAIKLYGKDSQEEKAVITAWRKVDLPL